MKKIIFFDTTLRDGEQMAGVNVSISDKIRIATLLSDMGVDVIEAGFPCSSKNDFTATSKIASSLKGCSVAGLSRASFSDIDICWDAIKGSESPRIHVFVATSDIHLKYKLKKTREDILDMIAQTVSYAKKYCPDVQFSAEDASRTDNDFLVKAFETAIKAGASTVNIADTVGFALPSEFEKKIRYVYENTSGIDKCALAVHCHNDLGLAVSNTLSAINAGATQVDCTINGIGERAGNASLEEIAMCIAVRKDILGVEHKINTKLIAKASKLVSNLTGVYVSPNKPVVGSNVFAHESGIHQHGLMASRGTYEIFSPEDVGSRADSIVLGKHSGHHAFNKKVEELGFHTTPEILKMAFSSFKNLSCRKKHISEKDIIALVEEAILDSRVVNGYELESYQIQCSNSIRSMAMVTLTKDEKVYEDAAIGNGPIEAVFNAVNKIIGKEYGLVSYEIKSVTGGTDAVGEVRVRISDENGEHPGRGFSTNILESSIKAYVNAINKALYYIE